MSTSEKKSYVGGQAILEGVMMRAGKSVAMAARRPDGTIALERRPVRSVTDRLPWLKWPVLRGVVMFYESLALGFQALEWSGQQAMPESENAGPKTAAEARSEKWLLLGTMVFGLVLGVALFGVVPYLAAQFTSGKLLPGGGGRLAFNLINGVYKMGVFLLYLWIMSWVPDLRRVFMYHGAEHKSIFAWEEDGEATLAAAAGKSRLHPRCSTAFLLLVVMVAILVFALVLPRGLKLFARLGAELALMIPIAGVTYELQRLSAKYCHLGWVRWLSRPGLALQGLTTREPEPAQIEVALAALNAVLEMEKVRELKIETTKGEQGNS